MDLRVRLALRLAGFSALLLVAAGAVLLDRARSDVASEVHASARLTELVRAASAIGSEATQRPLVDRLGEITAAGNLRHVHLSFESAADPVPLPGQASPLPTWLLGLLAVPDLAGREHRIALDDRTLVIRPDPGSEIREIARDAMRVLATLAVLSVAIVLSAWYAAHRALAPVRDLLAGLGRLEQGERDARLPAFELKEFASIGRAIDRLAESLGQARAGQQQLARRLLTLQEAERRELARELHDELGQTLSAIGVAAAYVERHAANGPAATLAECGREIGQHTRRIAAHVSGMLARLRPHSLEAMGLVPALSELLDSWRHRDGAPRFERDLPRELPALSPETSLALYRVMQEALTNVVRHSGATHCQVALRADAGELVLTVRDDGAGRADALARKAGGGLRGMRERIEMVGGTVAMHDIAPRGIEVEVRIPLEAKDLAA